jgi:hypothetical protein
VSSQASDASNGNGISIKALITAAVTALLLGFGGYLAGGVNRADAVKAEVDVFKAEISGRLNLIQAEQYRQAQDIAAIRAMVEKR